MRCYPLTIIVAGLIVSTNPARSQSIEGIVNSSGEYPRPAVVNALVDAEGLGQDYTDINGYYHIPPVGVIPPVQLHPQHGRQIRYGVWDILGRKCTNIDKNQNLDNALNNLSSGFYVLRAEEDEGIIQQTVIVNQSNVTKGKKRYLVKYNNVKPFDNVNNPLKNNNRNINTLYTYYIDDDLIAGDIGEFYGFVDTLDISGDTTLVKDVRLIPDIETNSPYYDTFLALMKDLERSITLPDTVFGSVENYGGYPNTPTGYDYPQRIWLNPEQAYEYCLEPELYLNTIPVVIDSINTKLERKGLDVDLFTIVEDSADANIWMRYTNSSYSFFNPEWVQLGGEWYIVGGFCYIQNNISNPQGVYATACHELGIRGLGMEGMSDDPDHIAHVPVGPVDFAPIEVDAMANHILQYNSTAMVNFIEE